MILKTLIWPPVFRWNILAILRAHEIWDNPHHTVCNFSFLRLRVGQISLGQTTGARTPLFKAAPPYPAKGSITPNGGEKGVKGCQCKHHKIRSGKARSLFIWVPLDDTEVVNWSRDSSMLHHDVFMCLAVLNSFRANLGSRHIGFFFCESSIGTRPYTSCPARSAVRVHCAASALCSHRIASTRAAVLPVLFRFIDRPGQSQDLRSIPSEKAAKGETLPADLVEPARVKAARPPTTQMGRSVASSQSCPTQCCSST